MDWLQVITVISVLGGFMFYEFTGLHNDIKSLNDRQDAQMARIDRLYVMFIDLLKDKK